MLDAYLQKGAALPTELDPNGRRRVIEDAITSTLLTPVRFMAPPDVAKTVSLLTGSEIEPPITSKLTLWPKHPTVSRDNPNAYFVEPDVVVDLRYRDHTARIVIEMKWDDVLHLLQVEAQLASAAFDLNPRDSVRHVCIVKYADVEVFQSNRTTVRQWSGVLSDLQRAVSWRNQMPISETSASWCRDAVRFLEKLGIGSFVGFEKLALVPITQQFTAAALFQFAWADLRPVPPLLGSGDSRKSHLCL
ncbi:hypothetical protein ACE10X_44535 [Bradyrhizobium sp. Pha-3]|uniref:hypothetical protein n=1 Tax=Bradyrhizobium sp. Pha-3 TaxID=208375 RepID=UPI0035D528EC